MSFAAFCESFAIKLAKPATDPQLAAARKKFGRAFPSSVRKIYETGNGGKAKSNLSALEIYSLHRSFAYHGLPEFFNPPWILWPLIENNDSDPICVCCSAALSGYVVQVNHGDAPRMLFRSLENFFTESIEAVAASDYLDIHELRGDFAGPDRTEKDRTAARKLIALAKKLNGDQLTDALCFAADLLGDDNIDEIEGLLDFDNIGAADHLAERLERIPKVTRRQSVAAKQGTPKPKTELFDDFVTRCGEILKSAGITATVLEMYGKNTIRLEPGSVWLNMQMFHENRRRDDFETFLIDCAKNAVKGKRRK